MPVNYFKRKVFVVREVLQSGIRGGGSEDKCGQPYIKWLVGACTHTAAPSCFGGHLVFLDVRVLDKASWLVFRALCFPDICVKQKEFLNNFKANRSCLSSNFHHARSCLPSYSVAEGREWSIGKYRRAS